MRGGVLKIHYITSEERCTKTKSERGPFLHTNCALLTEHWHVSLVMGSRAPFPWRAYGKGGPALRVRRVGLLGKCRASHRQNTKDQLAPAARRGVEAAKKAGKSQRPLSKQRGTHRPTAAPCSTITPAGDLRALKKGCLKSSHDAIRAVTPGAEERSAARKERDGTFVCVAEERSPSGDLARSHIYSPCWCWTTLKKGFSAKLWEWVGKGQEFGDM